MIHRRQFLISNQEHIIGQDWNSISLQSGFVISYQIELPIYVNESKEACLIGDAWQVDAHRLSPYDLLERFGVNTSQEEVYKEEETWCGRYVILVGNTLYLDAAGSLGVFYTKNMVSSSLYLMQAILLGKVSYPRINEICKPLSANYLAGKKTIINSINRLLPSEILTLPSYHSSIRPLCITHFSMKDDEIVIKLKELISNSLLQLSHHFEKDTLWLALTGGKDSRACCAALSYLGVKFNIYIADTSGMKDYRISYRIAKLLRKHYVFLRTDKSSSDNTKYSNDIYKHNSGLFVPMNQFERLTNYFNQLPLNEGNNVLLINGLWELSEEYYSTHEEYSSIDHLKETFSQKGDLYKKSIEDWILFFENDNLNQNISFFNRVYWDLRSGCWMADLLQRQDFHDHTTSIQVMNSRVFFELIMGLSESKRVTKDFEIKLTERWNRKLIEIPYEDNYTDLYIKTWSIVVKVTRNIKKHFLK